MKQQQVEHPKKVSLPETMPAFDSENPIHALYLKRKGVERILNKAVGRTLGFSFVTETRTNIERESMLIDRMESTEFVHSTPETILSFERDTSEQTPTKGKPKATDDYDYCPELSHYDSDDDSDNWSLPGIDKTTDIRYVYGDETEVFYDDGMFYDDERREHKHALAPEDPLKYQDSNFTMMGFLAWQFWNCQSEDRITIFDWIRCT